MDVADAVKEKKKIISRQHVSASTMEIYLCKKEKNYHSDGIWKSNQRHWKIKISIINVTQEISRETP